MTALSSLALAFMLLFDGTTPTPITVSDFNSVFTALTNQISVSTIVAVIAAVIGLTVGIAFMWWGARYGSRKIMAALKKGKTGA